MLLAVVEELLVDLVGKDDDVLGRGDLDEGLDLGFRINGAGRVARAVEDEHAGRSADGIGELFRRDLPLVLTLGLDDVGLGADEADHVGVARPVRRGDDDLVTGITTGENRVVARVLGTAVHRDLVRGVFDVVVLEEFVGNGLAQLGDATDGGVLRAAGLERFDRGVLDVLRRVEIRLSGTEAGDVLTLGLHFFRLGGDGEGQGGGDLGKLVGNQTHVWWVGWGFRPLIRDPAGPPAISPGGTERVGEDRAFKIQISRIDGDLVMARPQLREQCGPFS